MRVGEMQRAEKAEPGYEQYVSEFTLKTGHGHLVDGVALNVGEEGRHERDSALQGSPKPRPSR